eukprot:CAMPEP_0169173712 /NCGR_PEP_ID=MMETSP1015-20121227/64073_1 /TAXON_ID=342587 /ORGANISM="Karlodinium micrum, Strain CCMP2283" /LENGTH=822 /DNA_ID=CAMNT_0009247351 /DNA_START=127 /DNA_END=2595 /DNA_ORIENTATION=+
MLMRMPVLERVKDSRFDGETVLDDFQVFPDVQLSYNRNIVIPDPSFWVELADAAKQAKKRAAEKLEDYRSKLKPLEEQLGRKPTAEEWSNKCGHYDVKLFQAEIIHFEDVKAAHATCDSGKDMGAKERGEEKIEEEEEPSVRPSRLTRKEECLCSRAAKRLIAYSKQLQALTESIWGRLGRKPNMMEWAFSCGFDSHMVFQSEVELCKEAYSKLFASSVGLIYYLAKKNIYDDYSKFQDLVQEGFFAFNDAIETHDPSKSDFSSAAYWHVQNQMVRARQNYAIVHVPQETRLQLQRLWRAERELDSELGRRPLPHEVAEKTGMTTEKWKYLKAVSGIYNVRSMETPLKPIKGKPGEDSTLTLEYCKTLGSNNNVEAWLEDEETKRRVETAVQSLPDQEGKILMMKEGFCDYKVHSFLEITKSLGVPQKEVRRLHAQALVLFCAAFKQDNLELDSLGFDPKAAPMAVPRIRENQGGQLSTSRRKEDTDEDSTGEYMITELAKVTKDISRTSNHSFDDAIAWSAGARARDHSCRRLYQSQNRRARWLDIAARQTQQAPLATKQVEPQAAADYRSKSRKRKEVPKAKESLKAKDKGKKRKTEAKPGIGDRVKSLVKKGRGSRALQVGDVGILVSLDKEGDPVVQFDGPRGSLYWHQIELAEKAKEVEVGLLSRLTSINSDEARYTSLKMVKVMLENYEEQQAFKVGDRVRVQGAGKEWLDGIVDSVNPTMVKPDGWSQAVEFDIVEKVAMRKGKRAVKRDAKQKVAEEKEGEAEKNEAKDKGKNQKSKGNLKLDAKSADSPVKSPNTPKTAKKKVVRKKIVKKDD